MNWRSLLCVLLWFAAFSCAAAELRLAGSETMLPLEPVVEVFEDKSATLDVEQVAAGGSFAPRRELLHPGPTRSAIWLRFELVNDSTVPLTRWLAVKPASLGEVSLFMRQDGRWQRTDAGTHRPFAQWPIPARFSVLPVELPAGASQTIYLRVASMNPVAIMPALWEPKAFRETEGNIWLREGLMLGILAAMPLFGALMFFMFRDRAFLFNVLATTTFFLGESSAKGYSFMYLWPEATTWSTWCLSLFATLGVCWNILFLRALLHTRHNFPRMDRMLLSLLGVQGLIALGIVAGDYWTWAKAANLLNLFATTFFIGAGITAVIKGIKAARYYTAAFLLLAAGVLLHLLALTGKIPRAAVNEYILPVAMTLHNIIMLASVVDRIMMARREREKAKNELLAARAAHEAQLERAVEERTAELNTALDDLRRANQAQTRLVAYISHDLRAPLATIINYAHLLGRHDDAEVHRYKTTIERSAAYQLELIDELVEYARGEFERLELIPVPTYFHSWLENIASQAELLASQYGNRFLLLADEGIPPVVVFDPKRLQQVLLNLLSNAAKFTSEGRIDLRIQSRLLGGSRVELGFSVDDTGRGIAREDLGRIFEPFERCDSKRDGSGLGLSISRHLVNAMGGDLTVESSLGRGSSFGFRLTLETADENRVLQLPQAFALPKDFGAGKSVLVADDNSAFRDYLREVLFSAQFDVRCAGSGEEALLLASGRKFDLMLFDQDMPDMSGWELLRRLRAAAPESLAPAVLCSAMPPRCPPGHPPEADFAAALLKPVSADRLLQTVQVLLYQEVRQDWSMPSAAVRDPLRRLIAEGRITDIEEWAASLERTDPECAGFAKRIREAALRIDFTELNRLAGGTPQRSLIS